MESKFCRMKVPGGGEEISCGVKVILNPFRGVSIKVKEIYKNASRPFNVEEYGEIEVPIGAMLKLHVSNVCEQEVWWYL